MLSALIITVAVLAALWLISRFLLRPVLSRRFGGIREATPEEIREDAERKARGEPSQAEEYAQRINSVLGKWYVKLTGILLLPIILPLVWLAYAAGIFQLGRPYRTRA
jgi:hypothetical protein